MIDYQVLHRISYGLYVVASGNREKGNAYISNTVFQLSSDPALFGTCCSKNNYSLELIRSTGAFSVSVLSQEAGPDVISLGYRSGRNTNKMEGLKLRYGETGVPVILDHSLAFMEFKVTDQVDLASHLMFLGELVHAELVDEQALPMTYAYYREVKKGIAPPNAPTYIDRSKLK